MIPDVPVNFVALALSTVTVVGQVTGAAGGVLLAQALVRKGISSLYNAIMPADIEVVDVDAIGIADVHVKSADVPINGDGGIRVGSMMHDGESYVGGVYDIDGGLFANVRMERDEYYTGISVDGIGERDVPEWSKNGQR